MSLEEILAALDAACAGESVSQGLPESSVEFRTHWITKSSYDLLDAVAGIPTGPHKVLAASLTCSSVAEVKDGIGEGDRRIGREMMLHLARQLVRMASEH